MTTVAIDEFSITFDRADYRLGQPSQWNTTVHKVGPSPKAMDIELDGVSTIVLIDSDSVKLTGTREQLREALDQLELAYDRLVNPRWRDIGRAAAPTWTGD